MRVQMQDGRAACWPDCCVCSVITLGSMPGPRMLRALLPSWHCRAFQGVFRRMCEPHVRLTSVCSASPLCMLASVGMQLSLSSARHRDARACRSLLAGRACRGRSGRSTMASRPPALGADDVRPGAVAVSGGGASVAASSAVPAFPAAADASPAGGEAGSHPGGEAGSADEARCWPTRCRRGSAAT